LPCCRIYLIPRHEFYPLSALLLIISTDAVCCLGFNRSNAAIT
jgi:hypothetical protein